MDKNSPCKDEASSPSLMELLKKYTTRTDERAILRQEDTRSYPHDPHQRQEQQQQQQKDIQYQLKETVNKLQSKTTSINISTQPTTNFIDEQSNIDYKKKWEEAETKYNNLARKHHQLENGTLKQLQDKIDQLQHENNQFKLIKDRIAEICSCRRLTNKQLEQLKLLVSNNDLSIETIANKNDFHQQTIKLRDILVTHNNELLHRIEELMKNKRKRNHYDNDGTDNDNKND